MQIDGIRTINASREDDITATVVEVDSDNLSYDTPEGAWPEGLPHINGVLVLYDASDPASYVHVPELIGETVVIGMCYRHFH